MRPTPGGYPWIQSVVLAGLVLVGGAGRSVQPERLPVWTAPRVDLARLLAEDEARRLQPGLPPRVGLTLATDLTPSNSGSWEERSDRSRHWRLTLHSEGALWLVVGFDSFQLQRGARLWIHDPARHVQLGPFTGDDAVDGELWSPPIVGDTVVLELDWPAELARERPDLHLGRVSHGYRPIDGAGGTSAAPAGGPGSAPCEIDVNCSLGQAWQDAKRGVVRLLIPSTSPGGPTLGCTGSLVNDTAFDCKPYVLTANHCYDFAGSPPGTTFFFNFERPACEPGAPTIQMVTGAVLRASHTASDMRLLELGTTPLPAALNVYFNGWSRATQPPSEGFTIHHPMGDVKKISHDANPLISISASCNFGTITSWRVNNWEQGVAEPGSSGAPLFNSTHRIVGQLACGSDNECANGVGGDSFGRFDVSWNDGGSAATRLKDWLDPLDTGVTLLNGMDRSFCGAPAPRLVHSGHSVDDAQGNEDGFLDPGDVAVVQVHLDNEGPLSATGTVHGTLSTADPQVSVLVDDAGWPTILGLGSASSVAPHYTIDVNAARECGKSIVFQLTAQAAFQLTGQATQEGSWASQFRVPTGSVSGSTQPFSDDMESGTNGWTTESLLGTNPWAQTRQLHASGSHSWFVQGPSAVRDSVLVMPAISDVPPGAVLRFQHNMTSESGADGGVLEYTTDGGGSWQDAGPLIVSGPYNAFLGQPLSPLAGRLVWSGDLGDWRTVEVDLAEIEGADLGVRWRFATDISGTSYGWFVDDVVLEAPVHDCTPPHRRQVPGAYCRGQRPGTTWPPGPCGTGHPPAPFHRPAR